MMDVGIKVITDACSSGCHQAERAVPQDNLCVPIQQLHGMPYLYLRL